MGASVRAATLGRRGSEDPSSRQRQRHLLREQSGSTLIETVVASALLLVVLIGLLGAVPMAVAITENQGHLAARTTEYAQDKMEQLLALAYGDTTSDTRLFPATNANGTGLAIGGSSDTNAPVDKYVDYLDQNGNLLASANGAAPAGWFYKRVWQISSPSANLKLITVTATVASSVGKMLVPKSTVAALKTFPF
jgi:Tfp pilus assembly protein PilV